jgi:hypothetical protein
LKKICLILILFTLFGNAQEYVDLLKIGYGQTLTNNFEGSNSSTHVASLEVDLTYPVILNKKNALITGVSFNQNTLQLYPSDGIMETPFSNLYSTALKIGLSTTYNEKWSTTLVLLPKVASDYQNISKDDFYLDGLAIIKLQKKKNLIYRFGVYSSAEAFGFFTTPIIGWYYLSPNNMFEMNMSLPISADINSTTGVLTFGFDYYGIGRSFNISQEGSNEYVDLNSMEFASYIQFNAFEKSVLLRTKFGYSSND